MYTYTCIHIHIHMHAFIFVYIATYISTFIRGWFIWVKHGQIMGYRGFGVGSLLFEICGSASCNLYEGQRRGRVFPPYKARQTYSYMICEYNTCFWLCDPWFSVLFIEGCPVQFCEKPYQHESAQGSGQPFSGTSSDFNYHILLSSGDSVGSS